MKELKKILFFLLCFGAAVFIADRIFGFVIGEFFEKTMVGQSGGKINYYLTHPVPDVVVMGDSRALNQVIPDSFHVNTFNLSHAGMDDVFQESLLNLMIKKKKIPSTILLHLDPVFYSAEVNLEKALYLKPFYGESEVLTENINNSGKYERIKFLFSSYKYNNIVLNILNNSRKEVTMNFNGYEMLPATENDTARTRITAQIDSVSETLKLNPAKSKHLLNLISMCKANRIKLICFTGPVWKQKDISNQKEIFSTLYSLLAKNDVPYLNYAENSPAAVQQEGLWTDSYHLNEKGAKIFSQIISRDAQRLISVPMPTR